MKIRVLKTSSEVIDALGGNKPFARLVSAPGRTRRDQHVSNYRSMGLPADSYVVVTQALAKINCEALPSVWPHMIRPKAAMRRAS